MQDPLLLKLVYLGDIVAKPGRNILGDQLQKIKKDFSPDLVFVNGENSAGGRGITPAIASEIYGYGVDFISLGDHSWDRREIIPYLKEHSNKIIQPANHPSANDKMPGFTTLKFKEHKIGVINLLGRTFINAALDCPFQTADRILQNHLADCSAILIDFHAEATSEKYAFARYMSEKASLVVGTHTHVPTADQQIIEPGTGFISDLGMCGSYDHVLGMDLEAALSRFIGLPQHYKAGKGKERVSGIYAEISLDNGYCTKIERIMYPEQL